jgi:hypothetical protein
MACRPPSNLALKGLRFVPSRGAAWVLPAARFFTVVNASFVKLKLPIWHLIANSTLPSPFHLFVIHDLRIARIEVMNHATRLETSLGE